MISHFRVGLKVAKFMQNLRKIGKLIVIQMRRLASSTAAYKSSSSAPRHYYVLTNKLKFFSVLIPQEKKGACFFSQYIKYLISHCSMRHCGLYCPSQSAVLQRGHGSGSQQDLQQASASHPIHSPPFSSFELKSQTRFR